MPDTHKAVKSLPGDYTAYDPIQLLNLYGIFSRSATHCFNLKVDVRNRTAQERTAYTEMHVDNTMEAFRVMDELARRLAPMASTRQYIYNTSELFPWDSGE